MAWGWVWNGPTYVPATVPAGLSGIVAIAAGGAHSLALKSGGTVVAWGDNNYGQSTVPAGLNDVAAVAAGLYHSLALKSDGTVVAWGEFWNGWAYVPATVPASLNRVVAIAATESQNLALKADGTVVAWGDNEAGESIVPGGLSGVVAIAAEGGHSLALKPDGTVVAWGDNSYGQSIVPDGLSNVVSVAAGANHSLALKSDGTVVPWGWATVPAGLSGVVAIAAGGYHSLALKADGTVVAWGQIWNGSVDVPEAVPTNLNAVVAIAAGTDQSMALRSDGTAVAWGYYWNGLADKEFPAWQPTGGHLVAIAAGGGHGLALRSDGTVTEGGDDFFGEIWPPVGLSNVVSVAAGDHHSLALKRDGTVAVWGQYSYGLSTAPAGLSGVLAIAAGGQISFAIVASARASQRVGTTLVDLFYDLNGSGSAYTASVAVSSDAGASFTVPATHLTGDGVASLTAPGAGLHIVWDAGADFPGQFSTQMRMKVVVSGPEPASAESPNFVLDTFPPSNLDLNLTAWWTFDSGDVAWASPWDGTGAALDRSGNGRALSLTDFPESGAPSAGKTGQGLAFNNFPRYAIVHDSVGSFMFAGAGSISLWFCALPGNVGSGGDGSISPMLTDTDGGYDGGDIWLGYDGTNLFAGGVNGSSAYAIHTPVGTGQWVHAVWVNSDGLLSLYTNGVLVASRPFPGLSFTGYEVTLGRTAFVYGGWPGHNYFRGYLDDVRLYDRGLSASEIQQLYDGDAGGTLAQGLTGWWTFDDSDIVWTSSTTATALDLSGQPDHESLTLFGFSQASATVPGRIGQALSFPAPSRAESRDALGALMSSSVGSISLWFCPDPVDLGKLQGNPIGSSLLESCSSSASGGLNPIAWLSCYSYSYYGQTNLSVEAGGTDGANHSVSSAVGAGQWVHAVWVHSGGTLYLYKNGVEVDSTPLGNIADMSHPVSLGRNFSGLLGEVRVYNTALSPRQVWELYQLGSNATPPPVLVVTPGAATVLGAIEVGTTAERGFAVSNDGGANLSGTASVGAPFSIISGASYILAPGQSQTVTVRYSPTAPGPASGSVTFTGGGSTATRQVMGSAFSDPTPLTGAIAGRVMSFGQPVNGAAITVVGTGANLFNGGSSPGTMSGVIDGQAGSYLVTGLAPNAHYEVMATPPMGQLQQFYLANVDDVAVTAGHTTTVNIELTAVPSASQPPTLTPQETPVVLVRGTGEDKAWRDSDPSSEWGYWSALRSALNDAKFENVWDCNQPDDDPNVPSFPVYDGQGHVINGEEGIDFNARRLEYYVQQKALQFKRQNQSFPPSINIVAHSMGGLIAREAISLTGSGLFTVYDSADGKLSTVKVNKVVMLGTPNAGTVLADERGLYPGSVSWFQPSWTATENLTTDFVQNRFNPIYNPFPSSTRLYLAGGGGGPTSASFILAAGSAIIQLLDYYLPQEQVNDGAVPWPSVQGTFYKLTLPTLDEQETVSISLYPAVPPKLFPSLDHFELTSDPSATAWVIAQLTDPALSSVASKKGAASFGAGSPRPLDATQNPLMEEFESATGTLAPGASATNVVISDATTVLQFQMIAGDTNAVLRLNTPSGAGIGPSTPQTSTNVQYSTVVSTSGGVIANYKVSNPAQGAWLATLDGGAVTSTQASFSLMVFGDSGVAMLPQTGSDFNQGEDALISCALLDLSTNPAAPVPNASISATILFPDGSTNRLVLLDDGAHSDGAAGDGVFAAVLASAQQPGQYSISYRALGTNSQGQALQRVAAGAFTVSSGHGSLWGDPAYESLDTDGDGIADLLEVKCWVNLTAAGSYILAGDLVDTSGAHRLSQSAAFTVDASGPTTATLIFDLARMRAGGGQGTYHIENLQLFELTTAGIAWLDAYRGSSVVNIQAAKAINVSPQNLSTNVTPAVELRWSDGGASSNYDVYFGTNAAGLSFKTNQTSTTYDPGILAYKTAYYWRVDARNAAGVTTGDVWTFATAPAAVQGASLGMRTNCFGFAIAGASNLVIVVEACTDLAKPVWSPVATNTLSGGFSSFRDPQWTNYPTRFYRLRSP